MVVEERIPRSAFVTVYFHDNGPQVIIDRWISRNGNPVKIHNNVSEPSLNRLARWVNQNGCVKAKFFGWCAPVNYLHLPQETTQ